MSTTDTPTLPGPETEIELGYIAKGRTRVQWPDEDTELLVGQHYYDVDTTAPSAALLAAVKADGGQLVSRTITKSAVEVIAPPAIPLPTAKGSVVRAAVLDRSGETVERLFFSYGPADSWVADRPLPGGYRHTAQSSELTVLDVILDASTL